MCIQYIECHVADFASLNTNFWLELSSAELQICPHASCGSCFCGVNELDLKVMV